jgi:hypothetical protein
MSSLNARIHPFANRRRTTGNSSGDHATTVPVSDHGSGDDDEPAKGHSVVPPSLSSSTSLLPHVAPSPPSVLQSLAQHGGRNFGKPWAAPILSASMTASEPIGAASSVALGTDVGVADVEPPSPFAVSVRLHHRSALRTHDDVRDQFMRCLHLLNIAVAHHHSGDSSTTGTLHSKVVSRLRHHTDTSRRERHATLVNIQPVRLAVYRDGMLLVDSNGVASHRHILDQCRTLLGPTGGDHDHGGAQGGGGASMELYYRRGVARAATARSAVIAAVAAAAAAAATSSSSSSVFGVDAATRHRAILFPSSPQDLSEILDADESSALFVFRNPIDAHNAVSDICATFLPRVLQDVYPDGILLQGSWRGDEALPQSLEEYSTEGGTDDAAPSTSPPALVWVRQYAAGVLVDADYDRCHVITSGHADASHIAHGSMSATTVGHRLGGARDRRPQDRVLPHVPATEIQPAATTSVVDDVAPFSAGSDSPPMPPVIVLTPLGRWVFCRRASGTETWDDVRRWVSNEVRARSGAASRMIPSTASESQQPPAPSSIRFVIGTLVTGMSSSSSCNSALADGPVVVGSDARPMRWSDAIGDEGVVVRCSWA